MIVYHKAQAKGKWFKLSFLAQMSNIGSEVHRTINYRDKYPKDSKLAFERTLELIDLTLADKKNQKRLKELSRTRECLVDYFLFDNQYKSSDKLWKQYFDVFNWAYANMRHDKKRSQGKN